ncbi:hypothetical protein ACFYXH_05960 [Streptomyces sp. NPDC002730]|uniref:hypothetical protein n=1 Tax=Streptomyces sp. NPDC002730 TaxID=3364662 RepID=UPI0036B0E000
MTSRADISGAATRALGTGPGQGSQRRVLTGPGPVLHRADVVAMLQQAAPRAGELDSEVRDMGEPMERIRQDILAAAADA